MPKQSYARSKLEQARFFIAHASEAISAQQRDAFVNFIEAAIVYARSVTFYLQREYHRKTNFDRWYSEKQEVIKNDPIFRFFKDKRNYVLHEGPAGVHKVVSVVIEEHLSLSDSVEVKVIRGKPWYRRRPKILWEDLRATIMRPICRWFKQCKTKWRRLKPQKRSKVEVTEAFFFDDPEWRVRPALDLLQEYLDKLELIVVEAEDRFGNCA